MSFNTLPTAVCELTKKFAADDITQYRVFDLCRRFLTEDSTPFDMRFKPAAEVEDYDDVNGTYYLKKNIASCHVYARIGGRLTFTFEVRVQGNCNPWEVIHDGQMVYAEHGVLPQDLAQQLAGMLAILKKDEVCERCNKTPHFTEWNDGCPYCWECLQRL